MSVFVCSTDTSTASISHSNALIAMYQKNGEFFCRSIANIVMSVAKENIANSAVARVLRACAEHRGPDIHAFEADCSIILALAAAIPCVVPQVIATIAEYWSASPSSAHDERFDARS